MKQYFICILGNIFHVLNDCGPVKLFGNPESASTLIQVMVGCRFGANPLAESMTAF